jgi:hypothetical protein
MRGHRVVDMGGLDSSVDLWANHGTCGHRAYMCTPSGRRVTRRFAPGPDRCAQGAHPSQFFRLRRAFPRVFTIARYCCFHRCPLPPPLPPPPPSSPLLLFSLSLPLALTPSAHPLPTLPPELTVVRVVTVHNDGGVHLLNNVFGTFFACLLVFCEKEVTQKLERLFRSLSRECCHRP